MNLAWGKFTNKSNRKSPWETQLPGVSNWGGFGVAAGLYALRCCPVFDRYRRFGLGFHEMIEMDKLVPSKQKVSFF